MLKYALTLGVPAAVRYPRGTAYDGLKEFRRPVEYGKSEIIYQEEDIALIAVGSMVKTAVAVRNTLKEMGYSCSLVNARFVKPIDEEMIREMIKEHKLLVTMEENVASGGFGDRVREYLDALDTSCKMLSIAIPDEYVEHGNVGLLYQEVGIDADTIVKRVAATYAPMEAKEKS